MPSDVPLKQYSRKNIGRLIADGTISEGCPNRAGRVNDFLNPTPFGQCLIDDYMIN